MDFVDEQHILGLKVGKDGGQVAGPGDDRARRGAESHPQFPGDDLRQGGLAQSRRTMKQHVVHGFAAGAGRLDENIQVLAHLNLADEFAQAVGTQPGLLAIAGGFGRGKDAVFGHRAGSPLLNSASPARISASMPASLPSLVAAWETAPKA